MELRNLRCTRAFCFILLMVSLAPMAQTLAQDEKPAASKSLQAGNGWKVRVRAIDANGKAIPKSKIGTQLGSHQERVSWFACDQEGWCTLTLPDQRPKYCYIYARAEGHTPMQAYWWNAKNRPEDALPAEFTFEMVKGVTVGGVIVDEEGKPVEGALVRFSAGEHTQNPSRRAQASFEEHYLTDKEGKWRSEIAPPEMSSASINVSHQDFAATTWSHSLDDRLDELRKQKHIWPLKRGIRIRGRVVNEKGEPVSGAALIVCKLNIDSGAPIVRTDKDGNFRFRNVLPPDARSAEDPIAMTVSVLKPGYAPLMELVPGFGMRPLEKSTEEERIVNLELKPGVSHSFRIVDSNNNPIKKAWVIPCEWNRTMGLMFLREYGIPEFADDNGVWTWKDAPPGEEILFDVEAKGFARVRLHKAVINENGAEETIVMKRPQIIVGTVIEATTKKPIKEFVVQRAFEGVGGHPDGLSWTSDFIRGKDGKYRGEITMPPHNGSYTYRILADGYEPAVSESTPFEEGETKINFELTPKSSKK